MKELSLPHYEHRLKKEGEKVYILDPVRKKWLLITPEEWVRQNFIRYLEKEKGYPLSLMSIEMGLQLHQMQKRVDILIRNGQGNPLLIVECKAPEIKIDQKTFDQIARYDLALQVPYLIVTNGLNHYCCILDHQKQTYHFLKHIPNFAAVTDENH